MSSEGVNIEDVLTALADEIYVRNEREAVLNNGCWLSLVEDDGLYWGTTPYGVDWACNAGSRLGERLCNWIVFWNTPRNEQGIPLDGGSLSR